MKIKNMVVKDSLKPTEKPQSMLLETPRNSLKMIKSHPYSHNINTRPNCTVTKAFVVNKLLSLDKRLPENGFGTTCIIIKNSFSNTAKR